MPIPDGVVALLERIPATFWGVILGALFSLGGIALTNRAHDRRQRAQLDHDREIRKREREFALRRDVYLAASEAFSAGLIAVGRFSDPEIPNDKLLAAYLDKMPSVAKVLVIAGEQTVREVVEFSGELNATYVSLSTRRMPLAAQKQQLELLTAQVHSASQQRDGTLEQMRQHNLDHAGDQQRWKFLESRFELEQRQLAEATERMIALARTLLPQQIAFAEECAAEASRLGVLFSSVTLSIRSELELPIDEAEYKRIVRESVDKQEAVMKRLTETAQGLLS